MSPAARPRRTRRPKKHGRSIVKGGRGAATRTVRLLGGIFTYAATQGYLMENPCRGVVLYKDGKGERFLSVDEFGRLGETLSLAETEGLPRILNDGPNAKHRVARAEEQREIISRT
jgi:hypothetical protein